MIYTLENGSFTVRVSTLGAELQGLYSKKADREYMWQAAPEAWSAHSLLLFPCCGRIDRSRIIARGKEYPLPMHGFAKDREFSVLQATAERLVLQLSYDTATLASFPYRFLLRVEFVLNEDTIEQRFTVTNEGDDEMPFSLGGHPAFFCPVDLASEASDCVLEFDRPQHIYEYGLEAGTRLIIRDKTTPFLDGTAVRLSDSFFDNGPKVLGGVDASFVRLRSERTGRYMEMGIKGFPFMTLWGREARMTVIAIEPWCGTSDTSGTDHIWENKFGNEKLAPGENFERAFVFRLG